MYYFIFLIRKNRDYLLFAEQDHYAATLRLAAAAGFLKDSKDSKEYTAGLT